MMILWSRGMFPDVIQSFTGDTDLGSQAVSLEIARDSNPQGNKKESAGGI
jgi:hypothetical protein